MIADYCHWKCLNPHDWAPESESRAAPRPQQVFALFVLLCVDIRRTHFPRRRVGNTLSWKWPLLFILLTWQNVQFFLECILHSSMWGAIHSHQVLIMCQTIMSQCLASHVRELTPTPPPCCVTVCKCGSLRTGSYGAEPGCRSAAKWTSSMRRVGSVGVN